MKAKQARKRPSALVMATATVGGLGYFPVASGTAGTLGTILIYLVLIRFDWRVYVGVTAGLFLVAVFVSQRVRDYLDREDPGIVVIDEAVGFLVTMMFLPPRMEYVVAGFVLFRFLDIIKPWPASFFDKKVDNGMGIVMDDVAAGAYANVLLLLFHVLAG